MPRLAHVLLQIFLYVSALLSISVKFDANRITNAEGIERKIPSL